MSDPREYVNDDMARYFIDHARSTSLHSLDPSVKTGALIVRGSVVISWGWNRMPAGLNQNDPVRWEWPAKYMFVEHAERYAIYTAAYEGVKTKDCTMFSTAPPCADCARAIIQAGITEFYYPLDHEYVGRMDEGPYSINQALDMLREADVYVEVKPC